MFFETNHIPTDHNIQDQKCTTIVDNHLQQAQETIRNAIRLSLQEISDRPDAEKELLSLWTRHLQQIMDCFVEEAEKSGNSEVGKKIIRYMMFKRR